MATQKVALLGLGTMGSGMAANLLKAGFPLSVYNRTAAKAEPLRQQGATVAGTPAEAASGADVVIAMLSDDDASREAWSCSEGALGAVRPGTILVEASTVTPEWIAELDGLAREHGADLLDAPVTGSRVQAAAGQLTFLVGGGEATLAHATPVLEAMSKEIVYLGPVGSGAKMKLINNFLCGVQAASLAEGLAWIERSGLNLDKALSVLKNGAPGSPLLAGLSDRMVARNYEVNFVLRLMSKDLLYALRAASACGVDLTTGTTARDLFESAAGAGYGQKDMAAVIEPLRSAGRD